MRDFFKRLKRILLGFYRWNAWNKKLNSGSGSRIIYFNLSENKFERYLYLFIKFFLIEGYTIYIKRNFHFIGDLETYSSWLLKEENVHFCLDKPENALLTIDDDVKTPDTFLSWDYFTNVHHQTPDSYYVPMAMHPYLYHDGYWNAPIENGKRFQSVFFAGSFKKEDYNKPSFETRFGILNRIELQDALITLPETLLPKSLAAFNATMGDGKVYLVDRAHFSIPQHELRKYLSKFDFFLACPGVSTPLAHNLIEAMSCGCIPIIEKKYAELFIPSLHFQEALIFDKKEKPLPVVIREALQMDYPAIENMRRNVMNYYETNLTPHTVVNKIMSIHPQTIYLNAEAHSMRIFAGKE